MKNKKILSILIPAYNYPLGIARILDNLKDSNKTNFEIIIFDDSTNDEVQSLVFSMCRYFNNITYKKNSAPCGAVNNWNDLINAANGEYYILLHHDEFFLDPNFIFILINNILNNQDIDIFFSECALFDDSNNFIKIHTPKSLIFYAVKYFPVYLLRRNFIGPVSVLVVKKSLNIRFNPNLQWLVDVDFYLKLCSLSSAWMWVKAKPIGSIIKRKGSITNSLRTRVAEIERLELEILFNSHESINSIQFLFKSKTILFLESIIWQSFRFIFYIYSRFFIRNSLRNLNDSI